MKDLRNGILGMDSRLWPILLLLTAVGYLLYQIKSAPVTRFDDAFMYIRYADNLLAGKGYSWNGDQNTFGCTSITYTFFVTGAKWLFPNLPHYRLVIFSAGFWAMASLFLMGFTAYRILETEKLKNWLWITVGVLLFFGFNIGFRMNFLTGMDTMMSLFANTLLVLITFEAARKPKLGWFILLGLVGWFSVLTRPDNGIYVLLLPGLVFWGIFKVKNLKILLAYVCIGAFLVTDVGIKYLVFGDPLPLPSYVKQSGFYTGYIGGTYWNPIEYLTDFFAYFFPFTLAAVVSIRKSNWKLAGALFLPMALTFLYYFSVVQIMGTHFRFYFPGLPFLAFGSLLAFEHFWKEAGDQKWRHLKARIPHVVVLMGIWLGLWAVGRPIYSKLFLTNRDVLQEQLDQMNENQLYHHIPNWSPFDNLSRICSKLPAGTVVAASEHGVVAAENPHIPIIDLVGLHDPEIARKGFSTAYLQSIDPELIWLPHFHYVTLNYTLVNDPWFKERYHFIPGVFKFGIAIRKDRPDVFEVVLEELLRVYPKECYEAYLPPEMRPE